MSESSEGRRALQTYLQLLQTETATALPRGLARFPDNAELHAFAAQNLKSSGNAAGALDETRRALAANPRLSHGFLQLAQLEMDAGQPDSALAAIEQATKYGEDKTTVAQFARGRGNALYKAGTASQRRDDFQRAIKFLNVAERSRRPRRGVPPWRVVAIDQPVGGERSNVREELCAVATRRFSLTDAEINLVSGGSAAPSAASSSWSMSRSCGRTSPSN